MIKSAKPYVLAIDQGTTGTHVCILDTRLQVVGRAYRELRQHFPKPGWVEHDLNEIWSSVEACIAAALRSARLQARHIHALGITNQRETACAWQRSRGTPLHHAIVWQDRRTASRCAELKHEGKEPWIAKRTGLVLDPYFSATKYEWLLQNAPRVARAASKADLCFGTVDSWLVRQLTGGRTHVTDVSNGSRTLLMNLHTSSWDDELCALFGIPKDALPQLRSSSEVYGTTRGVQGLPDGIPISGMAGDQQAALFGQACFEPGDAKCTYGTGAFLLMNTGTRMVRSRHGLLTTVAWKIGDETHYALEGSAFVAGSAVQWLRDGLGLIRSAGEVERLAKMAKDAGEVVFVPALAGLGAPHWRPAARGLFCGIDHSTTKSQLARAVLQGIALQIYDLAKAMEGDTGQPMTSFKVDGGAAANNLLMQFQADLLGIPVVRPKNLETTSLGAAFLGGLGAGIWENVQQIRNTWEAEKTFRTKMKITERDQHLARWRQALERA